MVVLKNESNGIAGILKTDYTTITLKGGETINIDEKLILRKPSIVKMYSLDEYRKLNNNKKEVKVEEPKQEIKSEEIKEEIKVEEPKQEVKPPKKRRGRKPKNTEKGE